MKLDTYSFDLYQSIVDRWEKAWVVNIGATFPAPTLKKKFLKFFQKKERIKQKRHPGKITYIFPKQVFIIRNKWGPNVKFLITRMAVDLVGPANFNTSVKQKTLLYLLPREVSYIFLCKYFCLQPPF